MNKPLCLVPAMLAATGLAAVEPELRLGMHEVIASAELLSQHVHQGQEFTDEVAAHAAVAARIYGLGLTADFYVNVDDDESTGVRGGETTGIHLRADYLIEHSIGWFTFQFLPHWSAEYRPNIGLTGFQEPHWVGVDAWFSMPWDGSEFGGSFDYDLAGNHGWNCSGGFRQFISLPAVSLSLWQVANFGDPDYHSFRLNGLDDSLPQAEEDLRLMTQLGLAAGIPPIFFLPRYAYRSVLSAQETHEVKGGVTTIEAGATVTLPGLWEDTWVTLRFEGHWWVQAADRKHLRDTFEMIVGAGFEYRFRSDKQFIRAPY